MNARWLSRFALPLLLVTAFFGGAKGFKPAFAAPPETVNSQQHPIVEVYFLSHPDQDNRVSVVTNASSRIIAFRFGGSFGDWTTVRGFEAKLARVQQGYMFRTPNGHDMFYLEGVDLTDEGGRVRLIANRGARNAKVLLLRIEREAGGTWDARVDSTDPVSGEAVSSYVNAIEADASWLRGMTRFGLSYKPQALDHWRALKKMGHFPFWIEPDTTAPGFLERLTTP